MRGGIKVNSMSFYEVFFLTIIIIKNPLLG